MNKLIDAVRTFLSGVEYFEQEENANYVVTKEDKELLKEAIDTVVTALEKPLPSDEKIEQYALENILNSDSIEAVVNMKAWIQGAIWMRDLMKKRISKSDFLKSANDISEVTHPYDLSRERRVK